MPGLKFEPTLALLLFFPLKVYVISLGDINSHRLQICVVTYNELYHTLFFARFFCNSLFTLFIAEFILSFIWTSVELFLFSIMIQELMRIVTKVLGICKATVVYFFVLQEIKQNPV